MSDIRKCDNRFYEGSICPRCQNEGKLILSSDKRRKVSKFLSGLLRHFPSDYDLDIDEKGWVSTGDVLESCQKKYEWIESEEVLGIVATDNKGRFEVDGYQIRAAYGHSLDYVNLEGNNEVVPDILYHGTAQNNLSDILSEGLKPMTRQEVHMTDDPDEAITVAYRHCDDPVLLKIDAKQMMDDGHDVIKRGKFVYTSDSVPPEYIEER